MPCLHEFLNYAACCQKPGPSSLLKIRWVHTVLSFRRPLIWYHLWIAFMSALINAPMDFDCQGTMQKPSAKSGRWFLLTCTVFKGYRAVVRGEVVVTNTNMLGVQSRFRGVTSTVLRPPDITQICYARRGRTSSRTPSLLFHTDRPHTASPLIAAF